MENIWCTLRNTPKKPEKINREDSLWIVREDQSEIQNIIEPSCYPISGFYFVTGPHGVGKSTLFEHLCERTSGAFYFRLKADLHNSMFARKLGEAICFSFRNWSIGGLLETTFLSHYIKPEHEVPISDLSFVLQHLTKVGIHHYERFGHNLSLVIDDIERLPTEILKVLLFWAKQQVDSNYIRCIFLSSDSTVENILSSVSGGESMRAIPCVIKDVSEEIASNYILMSCLQRGYNISTDNAKHLASIIGGNVLNLNLAIIEIIRNKDIDKTILLLDAMIARKFKDAKLDNKDTEVTLEISEKNLNSIQLIGVSWAIFQHLISGPQSVVMLKKKLGEQKIYVEFNQYCEYLVKHNILFYDASLCELSFHDKLTCRYTIIFQEQHNKFISTAIDFVSKPKE